MIDAEATAVVKGRALEAADPAEPHASRFGAENPRADAGSAVRAEALRIPCASPAVAVRLRLHSCPCRRESLATGMEWGRSALMSKPNGMVPVWTPPVVDADTEARRQATDAVRPEAAAGASAVAGLGTRPLLDFLRSRTTGPAGQDHPSAVHATEIRDVDDVDADEDYDVDAELMHRLRGMFTNALPGRVSAIASSARSGDVAALASAAYTLAGTSGQLGHPEVASVCQAIAADARRGILAHARLVQLRELARI
jgi:HPt (histidine-containing phosphotransfer) domain-containing protein